jgi:hypothetical protein
MLAEEDGEGEAMGFDPGLLPFRPVCERISGFYLAERYPSLGGAVLEAEEVRRELPTARDLVMRLFPEERPE